MFSLRSRNHPGSPQTPTPPRNPPNRRQTPSQTFKNPKPELLHALAASGPVPGGDSAAQANGVSASSNKKKPAARKDKSVDMDKLAEGLQRLTEDDLINVVQMVHEQKSSDTYTKNDVESMFYIFSLPCSLTFAPLCDVGRL